MTNFKILALDPGTNYTGWCLGHDGYHSSGVETLRSQVRKRTIWERCYLLGLWLDVMIEQHEPDLIGVEWPMGFGGNAAKIKLGMILGSIAIVAGRANVLVLEVNPQSVKQTDVHKGSLEYAAIVAGRKVRKDEADAIGAYLALDGKLLGLTLQDAEAIWGRDWSTR